VRTILDLGSATVEVTAYEGTDLLAVRGLVARGDIVLLRAEIPEPTGSRWPHDLAESIAECAIVPLSQLVGSGERRYPLLAARPEQIRFLCSYAERKPEPPFPYESRPVATDYREFRHLWVNDGKKAELDIDGLQIGRAMAALHAKNMLHGDAHRGNWLFDDSLNALIHDPDPSFLHCPPTPEQCATDIRPLLPDLTPGGWLSFRHGYRATWPGEGRVIDLIQLGDLTGWAAAFRERNYERVVELIGRELAGRGGGGAAAAEIMLLANRAMAFSRLKRAGPAWQDYRAAVELAARRLPSHIRGLGIVEAVILAGEGREAEAMGSLRNVTEQPEKMLRYIGPADAKLPIINM
jgi:hypothetical protein